MTPDLLQRIRTKAANLASWAGAVPLVLDDVAAGVLNRLSAGRDSPTVPANMDRLREGLGLGVVSPETVPHVLDREADKSTSQAVQSGEVTPDQAQSARDRIREHLDASRPELQRQAYRGQAGHDVLAPTSIPGAGLQFAKNILLAKLIGGGFAKVHNRFAETPISSPSWWQSTKAIYGPTGLAVSGGLDAIRAITRPRHDPRVTAGESGYAGSVMEGIGGEADALERAGGEVDRKYGPGGGIPIRMLHALTNPLASVYSLGRTLKDKLLSETPKEAAEQAADAVRWELELAREAGRAQINGNGNGRGGH